MIIVCRIYSTKLQYTTCLQHSTKLQYATYLQHSTKLQYTTYLQHSTKLQYATYLQHSTKLQYTNNILLIHQLLSKRLRLWDYLLLVIRLTAWTLASFNKFNMKSVLTSEM